MYTTHHSPPKGVGEIANFFVLFFLDEVDQEREEDQTEEADVDGRDQLLSVSVYDGPQQLPRASASVHAHHTQDLEEPEAS